ncbi:MAG: helix-turn-helix domain-containing protein [Oscillospiraceae bacterium]
MTESTFSERLRTLRKARGLTQQELADRLNVSNKSVSRWESAGGYPDIELLPALAGALGATVDELLSDSPVRRLSAFDWQNMLSFALAIGGGVLFFLLKLFTPAFLCYCIYLGALGYGVYLQSRYTFRSDWFYRLHLVMNFFVNFSLLASLPFFATSISVVQMALAVNTLANFGSALEMAAMYSSNYLLLALLCLLLAMALTSLTQHILRRQLDGAAPKGVWAILRGTCRAAREALRKKPGAEDAAAPEEPGDGAE